MTVAIRAVLIAASLTLSLPGCATTQQAVPHDPWEHFNRGSERFNDSVDRAVLKPVTIAYRKHVPQVIRTGVSNFIGNLKFTTTIVNDLLQLKLLDTGADIGRFVLNSTLGIGGLLDPATRVGIRRNDEDFGQTLGRWGVPAGPYIVLPLLGPSTLRDTPALAVDWQTDLRAQLNFSTGARIALTGQAIVVRRESLLSADETLDSAFDRYAFIRNAWLQRREYLVRDGDVPEEAPLEDEPESP
jgi:phospholipid-binding lipoprotein MlaA